MSENYTEVTTVTPANWGERLGNSMKGIGTGVVLIIIASVLLFWNEGRSVRSADAIAEAEIAVVDMTNIDTVDPSFNGKLVYSRGMAKTKDILSDSMFGVKQNATHLKRDVKYYQWTESSTTRTVKRDDGKEDKITEYSYQMEWVNAPVNSSSFKKSQGHENRALLPTLKNEQWTATNVSFGAYTLPKFMISSVSSNQKLTLSLSEEEKAKIQKDVFQSAMQNTNMQNQGMNNSMGMQNQGMYNNQGMQNNQGMYNNNQGMQNQGMNNNMGMQNQGMQNQGMYNNQSMQNQGMYNNQQGMYNNNIGMNNMGMANQPTLVHVRDNSVYLGYNEASPQIGDMIISYTYTPADNNISIVAQVAGSTFEPFMASNGNTFSKVSTSQASKQVIFQNAKDSNSTMTWVIRVVGMLLVIGGFKMILAPLVVLVDVIPFVSGLISAGVGLIASLLGFSWTFIIVAIAWIRYRPILAFTLLGLALVFILFVVFKGRSAKPTAAPQEAPAE